MKAFKIIFSLFIITIGFYSCENVLEEDITNQMVIPISPLNGDIVTTSTVPFKWQALKGAKKYRLQVLNASQTIIKDTLTDKITASIGLLNGNYYWKVRAENFAYVSIYSNPISFSVNSNQVVLTSPADEFYTNATTFNVAWQALAGATAYDLQINNVTTSSNVVSQPNLTATTYAVPNSAIALDAKYEWKVKPIMSGTLPTTYSTRYFYIDRVMPNQPTLTAPANNASATQNTSVNFTWTMPADSGTIQSPIVFVIEFATDIAFTNIIQTSTTSNPNFQRSFVVNGTPPTTYYWRVTAKDKAGNASAVTTPFALKIQ